MDFYELVRVCAQCQSSRRGGVLPRPAGRGNKFCTAYGDNVKRSVGADASVRPWGNGKFVAAYRKNGRAPRGSMRRPQASFEAQPRAARLLAPKMGIDPYKYGTDSHRCIRFCGCAPPGGQGRPPLRVHTVLHWCIQFCDVVPRGRGRTPPLRQIWRIFRCAAPCCTHAKTPGEIFPRAKRFFFMIPQFSTDFAHSIC